MTWNMSICKRYCIFVCGYYSIYGPLASWYITTNTIQINNGPVNTDRADYQNYISCCLRLLRLVFFHIVGGIVRRFSIVARIALNILNSRG